MKDLEVYATPAPPRTTAWSSRSPACCARRMRSAGSGFISSGTAGGAASLAVAAARPERLASLALLEPAWAGTWDLSPSEQAVWLEHDRLEGLRTRSSCPPCGSASSRVSRFPRRLPATRLLMAKIRAFLRAFKQGDPDREALRRFDRPVYCALGAPEQPRPLRGDREAPRRSVSRLRARVFDERHHSTRTRAPRARESLAARRTVTARSLATGPELNRGEPARLLGLCLRPVHGSVRCSGGGASRASALRRRC